jgi:hypothetical protein
MNKALEKFVTANPEWRDYVDLLLLPPQPDEIAESFPDAAGKEIIKLAKRDSSYGMTCGAIYVRLRCEGSTHMFAEMVALQRGPRIMTDSVFFAGQGDLLKQFQGDRAQLESRVALARKHGYNPGPSDIYNPNLARFPGDPEAWIPPSGGRAHIRKVLAKRGWGCQGAVELESRPNPPPKFKDLADDLAVEAAREMATRNPELRRLDKRELIAEARLKHSYQKKNPLKAKD